MEKYQTMRQLVNELEKDFTEFYVNHNKAVGLRIAKHMQELRGLAEDIRRDIQTIKHE